MQYGFGYFEEDKLGEVTDFNLWRRILGYAVHYWQGVALAVFLSFAVIGSSLLLPYLVRLGVDNYIINVEITVSERFSGLTILAVIFGVAVIVGFIGNYFQVTVLEWTGQNIMHRLRQHIYIHMLGLDLAFFNENPSGKLVTRLTNDVQNMHEMFTSVIVTLFNDVIRIIGILVLLYWLNWRLAVLMTLLLPAILVATLWFSKIARNVYREIRTNLAKINAYLQEAVSGISLIQLFQREKDTERSFVNLNQAYFASTVQQIKIFGIFMPVLDILASTATAISIWYGGILILRGEMTIGILVAFLSYMRLFFQPLRELSQKYSIVQSAMASAERIFQLLDTRSGLPVLPEPFGPQAVSGTLEFSNVTFGYDPDKPVIHNLSMKVAPGETVAIVGATGSGKSTLINLLERMYDPDSGRILLDGHDLRELDPQWLRNTVGLVMQEVYLLRGTIKENILLDSGMGEQGLTAILQLAQLDELIGRLPQGIHTKIGEGNLELSAGERQLLTLARVMVRDPEILVLDEATANVDSETEILVERAIDATLSRRTSIVIAHRLSTIRRADRIIFMDSGQIVEEGTHEKLMADKGFYNRLQNLQYIEWDQNEQSHVS
ncbi:MAG: ABC transporter ATP-binding protein/permease [Desulfobulbaceae bacterium]|jgi:ATP-binding cassette subfamily B multidrug efflux pump|nr:ABC transporter ATP-binding protein/permease [Desulfobulbaceae bacterium]MDH3541463.1 ABC transporter ATP-binding protein/permease [Desulfobulbaceae bacterium]MDH3866553.1 ABC transporter ATP-binding protein/permease [Desulfobulbaceae bacterium]